MNIKLWKKRALITENTQAFLKLQKKLALLTENTQILMKGRSFKDTESRGIIAVVCSLESKTADVATINNCLNMLETKSNVNWRFSWGFALYIAVMMSLTEEPEQRLTDTLYIYSIFNEKKFRRSLHMAPLHCFLAAQQIAAGANSSRFEPVIDRTISFYEALGNHGKSTGLGDCIFSVMLGLSDIDVSEGVDRRDRLYQSLPDELSRGYHSGALLQVLALGNDSYETQTAVLRLCDTLRDNHVNLLGNIFTLPALGLLSLLTKDASAVSHNMSATIDTLCTSKVCSDYSLISSDLLLYAASLVSSVYSDDMKNGALKAAILTGITNLIVVGISSLVHYVG